MDKKEILFCAFVFDLIQKPAFQKSFTTFSYKKW